jgi:prepilin-type N-terminal cleavage/methylation domain-containing protein
MARESRRGVTLIELVTVIVILSLLLGLSIALFKNANRDLGVRASTNHLVAVFRSVHDQARAGNSPAWVVINVEENSVYAMTKETVGEWHFEDTVTTGAFGRNGRVNGTPNLVQGRVGQAMVFPGAMSVDCGDIPVYHVDQGIALEFWYLRVPALGRQSLCAIGEQLEMAVEANGTLSARIGSLSLNSGDIHLRNTDVWYFLQLIYNGREAQLFVNGASVGSKAGRAGWAKNSPLIIGKSKNNCIGVIDEFRVSLIFPREKFYLPSEAKFELPHGYLARGQTEFVIHYDTEGRLDRRRHTDPLRFKIKSPTEEKEIILNPTGLISR